jgi:hypothetical protein
MTGQLMASIGLFYVLDMDRCLVNTDKLTLFLQGIVSRELGIDSAELELARMEYENEGGAFDMAGYAMSVADGRGKDGPEVWHKIQRIFVYECQAHDMLNPYGADLLNILRSHAIPFGIVTFGGDAWQLSKLAAAGLSDIPHIVTHEEKKGRLLRSWQRSDGAFLLPPVLGGETKVVTQRLVFIDDKPKSFVGLPEEVVGICAISPGVIWPSKVLRDLPDNVRVVKGLHDAIELIKSHKDSLLIDKT